MRTALSILAATLLQAATARGAEGVDRRERETAGLRVKFAEGVALEAVGRWADALDRFVGITPAAPTAEVQFHVGLCLDRLGRLREATRAYRAAREHGRSSPLVVTEATARLLDLDVRMPRVMLTVDGDRREVTVRLDGELVEAGTVLRIDAGPHIAVASRRGVPLAAVAFSAQERRHRRVKLRVLVRADSRRRAAGESASSSKHP